MPIHKNTYIAKTYINNLMFVDFLDKETRTLFYKVCNKYKSFCTFCEIGDKICIRINEQLYSLSIFSPDTLQQELQWLDEKFEGFRSEFFIRQLE